MITSASAYSHSTEGKAIMAMNPMRNSSAILNPESFSTVHQCQVQARSTNEVLFQRVQTKHVALSIDCQGNETVFPDGPFLPVYLAPGVP